VLHVVCLAADQASKVQNNTLSLITLSEDCEVSVLKCGELFLVALPLTLKFFSNFLLQNKSLQSIVSLFLSTRKADSETSSIILLLVNERSEAAIFAFMVLNLNFKILGLLCELFGEGLEFEELEASVGIRIIDRMRHLPVVSSSPIPRQGSCFSL
jgi:hypothetical protein